MLFAAEAGDLRMALCGDVMLTRPLRVHQEERFLRLQDLLHSVDCVFANLESTARAYDEGSPNFTEGTHMTTEPRLLADLTWLGVGLVSCANNHAYDFGEFGVLANLKHLDAAGIAHAGTGSNLRRAQSPAYSETPAGRVALLAATSTFGEWNRAVPQGSELAGKPGVTALGFDTIYEVESAALEELRRIGARIGVDAERARRAAWFYAQTPPDAAQDANQYRFLGRSFIRGSRFAISTRANQRDLGDLLRQVKEARRQADWVIVSIHCHEQGGSTLLTAQTQPELLEPADFVKDVAHACIDAGADIIAGHGPHATLGIEVYAGKPIFYSLGDFIMQNETVRYFPAHAYERFGLGGSATPADFLDARTDRDTKAHPAHPIYWQSVVAVCTFKRRALAEVQLHPVDLGHARPRSQRGRPLLAEPEVGANILSRLQELSRAFGTHIESHHGIGSVVLPGD
jgi:poly-gamma-glutamate synthesis protein (capsule biosynthesis protein)